MGQNCLCSDWCAILAVHIFLDFQWIRINDGVCVIGFEFHKIVFGTYYFFFPTVQADHITCIFSSLSNQPPMTDVYTIPLCWKPTLVQIGQNSLLFNTVNTSQCSNVLNSPSNPRNPGLHQLLNNVQSDNFAYNCPACGVHVMIFIHTDSGRQI